MDMPTVGLVTEALRRGDALTSHQVSTRSGVTWSTVAVLLPALAELGHVARERRGRTWWYRLAAPIPAPVVAVEAAPELGPEPEAEGLRGYLLGPIVPRRAGGCVAPNGRTDGHGAYLRRHPATGEARCAFCDEVIP